MPVRSASRCMCASFIFTACVCRVSWSPGAGCHLQEERRTEHCNAPGFVDKGLREWCGRGDTWEIQAERVLETSGQGPPQRAGASVGFCRVEVGAGPRVETGRPEWWCRLASVLSRGAWRDHIVICIYETYPSKIWGLKPWTWPHTNTRGQEPSSALARRCWFTQGFSLVVATACLGWGLSQVAPHRLVLAMGRSLGVAACPPHIAVLRLPARGWTGARRDGDGSEGRLSERWLLGLGGCCLRFPAQVTGKNGGHGSRGVGRDTGLSWSRCDYSVDIQPYRVWIYENSGCRISVEH